MSAEIENWAKKYEELTNSDKLLVQWQNITHVHSCLIWKKQKS